MAVYKIFPEQDATIYSAYPILNSGLDAILQISNQNPATSASAEVARSLVQFDQDGIENIIDNFVGNMNFSSSLKLFIANANGITMNSNIECYATGQFLNSPQTTNGCSWDFRFSTGSERWADNEGSSTLNAYVTCSYSGSTTAGGGTWYTGSQDDTLIISSSQNFNTRTTKDIDLNVTDIVKIWYSSSNAVGGTYTSIENNGFILKWTDASTPVSNSDIEFKNVGFKYYRKSKTNDIDDINLELSPGKIVGLIGPPGSGKSTISNLIPRNIEWIARNTAERIPKVLNL